MFGPPYCIAHTHSRRYFIRKNRGVGNQWPKTNFSMALLEGIRLLRYLKSTSSHVWEDQLLYSNQLY